MGRFLELCHPGGVHTAKRVLTPAELRASVTKFVTVHAADHDHLADLVDPSQITMSEVGELLQFEIPVKSRLQPKYGEKLSFTLEKCDDDRWRIVQSDL